MASVGICPRRSGNGSTRCERRAWRRTWRAAVHWSLGPCQVAGQAATSNQSRSPAPARPGRAPGCSRSSLRGAYSLGFKGKRRELGVPVALIEDAPQDRRRGSADGERSPGAVSRTAGVQDRGSCAGHHAAGVDHAQSCINRRSMSISFQSRPRTGGGGTLRPRGVRNRVGHQWAGTPGARPCPQPWRSRAPSHCRWPPTCIAGCSCKSANDTDALTGPANHAVLRPVERGILGSRTSGLISCRSLPAGRQAPLSRQDPWWESRPRYGGFVAGLRPQGGFLAGTNYTRPPRLNRGRILEGSLRGVPSHIQGRC